MNRFQAIKIGPLQVRSWIEQTDVLPSSSILLSRLQCIHLKTIVPQLSNVDMKRQ